MNRLKLKLAELRGLRAVLVLDLNTMAVGNPGRSVREGLVAAYTARVAGLMAAAAVNP